MLKVCETRYGEMNIEMYLTFENKYHNSNPIIVFLYWVENENNLSPLN